MAQKRYRKKINDSRKAWLNKIKQGDLKEGGKNIKQDDSQQVQENIKQDNSQEVQENIKQDSSRGILKWLIINYLKFQFLVADIFRFTLSLEIFQVFPLFSFLQIEPDKKVAVAVIPDEEESSGSLRYFQRPSV